MFLNRAGVQNNYSCKVRVGNWSEEQEMEELRMKEFIHRKEKGQLLVHSIQKHMNSSLQEVGLSHSADGLVHIGDHVMLYSVASEGVLSCDPSDKAPSSDRGFLVSSSALVKAPVARNVFVVEAVGGGLGEPLAAPGSVLRLGQQFRLRCNPAMQDGQAYYLQSQPVSSLAASKVTRKQLVCMSSVKSFDTVWKAAWKDIARRFEQEGSPVPANAEVVIIHAPTNTALSSTKDLGAFQNDFGLEYEVCGHSHIDIRKSQGLYAEQQGKTTTDIPARKEERPNHFAFLTASSNDEQPSKQGASSSSAAAASSSSSSSFSASSSNAPAAASSSSSSSQNPRFTSASSSVLLNVREDLLSRGPEHLFAFLRGARGLDARRSGHVSYDDLRRLLLQAGLKLRLEDFESLCRSFDFRNDKHVDYVGFIDAISGGSKQPPARTEAIAGAWAKLDPSGSGAALLQVVDRTFEPAHDPEVKMGRRTQNAARDAIMTKMRALSAAGKVARQDFELHYAIVSAYVESDDYFVDLVTNSWKNKQ